VNAQLESATRSPRLGFLGVGWIGRQRLKALVDSGAAVSVVAIADNEPAMLEAAAAHAPGARATDRSRRCSTAISTVSSSRRQAECTQRKQSLRSTAASQCFARSR